MQNYRAANKKTSLVYGVAKNDSTSQVLWIDGLGKKQHCPFYIKWQGMLSRVYNPRIAELRPNYSGVTIHPDWLLFSNFRQWMEQQDWEGKHLDKDLLVPGNKQYGPNTCLFISHKLNNLLTLRQADRGMLPLGVGKTTIKGYVYYTACCSFYGKQKKLGYFHSIEEASTKYLAEKNAYIQRLSAEESDPKVSAALKAIVLS